MAVSTSVRRGAPLLRLHSAPSDPLPRAQLAWWNMSSSPPAGGVEVGVTGTVVTGVDDEGPPPPQDRLSSAVTATAEKTAHVLDPRLTSIMTPPLANATAKWRTLRI